MVVGQILPVNPAHAVRGPKHAHRRGKTPVLQADEARALLDSIDITSLPGLRDRSALRRSLSLTKSVERIPINMRMAGRGWMRGLYVQGSSPYRRRNNPAAFSVVGTTP